MTDHIHFLLSQSLSTTVVDWHLKVKDKKKRSSSNQKLLHHVSTQKISSIHKLIWQILGSHELNDQAHFWPGLLLNLHQHTKISSFHLFIFEIQPILESCDQAGHTHFWPYPPINFWSTFDLYIFVSTCKKSGYFIDSFWRYDWLKNPAIWLIGNILPCI